MSNEASAEDPNRQGPDGHALVRRAAYQRADAEARAALAIVGDPSTDASTAGVHLVRGLQALARVAAPELDDASEALTQAPSSWGVDGEALARCLVELAAAEADREQTAVNDSEAGPLSDAAVEVRRAHLSHARALVAGTRAAEHMLYGDTLDKADRQRLRRGIGLTAAVAIPTLIGLVLTVPSYREGPWRGAYYETKDFTGEPQLRRNSDIRYDWNKSGPLRDFPDDAFSVRWDTCMLLDAPTEVAFRVTSNDGARLFVDGKLIVNNWGVHDTRTRGKRASLDEGLHHVRVAYFDDKGEAAITVVASLHGERPEQIPTRILHYPGETIDDEDPCAAVREALGH